MVCDQTRYPTYLPGAGAVSGGVCAGLGSVSPRRENKKAHQYLIIIIRRKEAPSGGVGERGVGGS